VHIPSKPYKPIEIFYSYSHKDEHLRAELETHLAILKQQGIITGWYDRRISAGKEWKGEIDKHLNTAAIVLLLISADFIASDYCYDVEMKRAMERHKAGEARVIPIILRPSDWKGTPFDGLQALPKDAKPVVNWRSHDEAFRDVEVGIRGVVEEFIGKLPVNHIRKTIAKVIISDITLPKVWVDRSNDAKKLEDLLKRTDESAPRIIEIQQLGGSGKSCFTRKFFDEVEERKLGYEAVIWFSFYKLRSIEGSFGKFLDYVLNDLRDFYPIYFESRDAEITERADKTIYHRLKLAKILRNEKILMFLDGLEVSQKDNGRLKDPEFYNFLSDCCNFDKSHVIISTRVSLRDFERVKGYTNFNCNSERCFT